MFQPPQGSPCALTHSDRSPLVEFYREWFEPYQLRDYSTGARSNYRIAINRLADHLARPPVVADLTDGHLAELLEKLRQSHSPRTCDTIRLALQRLGAGAAENGLLARPPSADKPAGGSKRGDPPWTLPELNLLLAAARSMPGAIDGIPAGQWWPALLLLILDTGAAVRRILAATPADFRRRSGVLCLAELQIELHTLTVEALDRLPAGDRPRLIPWPLDNGRPPFFMLYRAFRGVLWRATLPHVERNLFKRLQHTAQVFPEALDRLDLSVPLTPREGAPHHPRAARRNDAKTKGKRRARYRQRKEAGGRSVGAYKAKQQTPDSLDSLLKFYREVYAPIRLTASSELTTEQYELALAKLNDFAGGDVTLAQLSDDFVERFLAWCVHQALAPDTINKVRRHILALWNYAHRKRRVAEPPRDVPKHKTSKRAVSAWSTEELGQLLTAAAEENGHIGRVPAGRWWPALILFLYYTGLRVRAALSVRAVDFDPTSGYVLARAETQKQSADQLFKLPPDATQAIAATATDGRDALFPHQFSDPRPLRSRFRSILKRADLPHGRKDLFHKLRRTCATFIADAAGDRAAQTQLGHSDPKLLERYVDRSKVRRVEACDLIPRPTWRPDGGGQADA